MAFGIGDQVEVCSNEEGFVGSFFEATVIKRYGAGDLYAVRYKNLVEESDESIPLVERIYAHELRPVPPNIPLTSMPGLGGFSTRDVVDAFDNDGWWVGRITGKQGSRYLVYFDTTNEECAYDVSKLRRHLDWINGKWVLSRRIGY